MDREPVAIITAVIALFEAALVAFVAFGWSLSGEQVTALMGVVIAAGAVVQALWTRSKVSPAPKTPPGRKSYL